MFGKVFIRLLPVLNLVGVALVFATSLVYAQQSPEEMRPREVNGCTADSECPLPKPSGAQEQSCLLPRCVNHECTVGYDTGALISRTTDPASGSCFVYQYECGPTGEVVVRNSEQGKVAANEGELCTPESAEDNVCVAFTCSNKRCVRNVDRLNGRECPRDKANPKPNRCQKAQCAAGVCSSIADSSTARTSCGDDVPLPDGCQVNKFTCNDTGRCLEATVLNSGAECGPPPNNLIAQSELLPESFRALFLNATKPPQYTCNSECRLEYCGDGIRNGSESCDGADLPQGVPTGSRCSSDCKVTSPDCSAYENNPNFVKVPSVGGNGSVTIPGEGSFSGLLSEIREALTRSGYLVEVAWEPNYSQGITGPDALNIHAMALCAWKPIKESACDALKDKQGVVITALGIVATSCASPEAQFAYDKFRQDYRGYQSLFTGNNVGYSVGESENYIYPFPDPSVGPEEMKYCEVCYYPECGNGVRTPDEQCDGNDLGPDAQPGDVCSSSCTLGPCQILPDQEPTCSIDPVTGEGVETRKTFSQAMCGFEETTERKAKPSPTCVETVLGKTAVKSAPTRFVLIDGSCQWEKATETISSPFTPTCSLDPATGNGIQTGSTLNTTTCQWADGRVIRPKPAPSCTETVKGRTAVLKTATRFVRSGGACTWETSVSSTNSNVTPGCVESGSRATLTSVTLESNVKASPPICRFSVTSATKIKPADNCVEEKKGSLFYATKNTYTFNKNVCDYVASPKSTVKPPVGCREVNQRVGNVTTYSAEATNYTFNAAKCGYDSSKSTTPKPAPSCIEENQNGKTYAVSRANWSLNTSTCAYKTTERKTPRPASASCSAQNGQRYSTVTLNAAPNSCSYTTATGSCCYYSLSAQAGLKGQNGLKVKTGTVGCLQSVINNAAFACRNSQSEYVDDCIAVKVTGNYSLNSGCSSQALPPGAVLCGSAAYSYYMSPISLRWLGDADERRLSFSRFSLSGALEDRVVVWKASSALPLLVYDPEHNGMITSATQLFGNVFRGGRQAQIPWSDGYEALGSLDLNTDGIISGEELSPLGLWFDANRDGVSQSGEVKPLNHHDVNVTKLFYKGGVRNELNKDIELPLGFERIIGGRIDQGASVDWYAEESRSQDDLLNSLIVDSFFKRLEANRGESSTTVSAPLSDKQTVSVQHLFRWKSEDSFFLDRAGHKPYGILSLVEYSDGSLRGHAFFERVFEESGSDYSQIQAMKVTGKVESQPDGSRKFTFEAAKDQIDGVDARSTAVLNKEGSELLGQTEETLTYEGRERTFSYTWKGLKE